MPSSDVGERRLAGGRRLSLGAAALGLLGLALTAAGAWVSPRQAAFSWLAGFGFALTLALGALVFLLIQHATGATWSIVLRRPIEAAAGTLPLLALLFVPLLFALDDLYPWAGTGAGTAAIPEDVRQGYLNAPLFIVRAAICFALWIAVPATLRRWSRLQAADARLTRRSRALGAVALPPVAFTMTFAAIDWFMSLEAGWVSTVFGVYIFAGSILGFLALLAVAARLLDRGGALGGLLTPSHHHALGKLILTFLIFWAYIAFVQYLLIWIADIPAEAVWYVKRTRGGWAALAVVLVLGHFALPFFLLLSRTLKRRPTALAAVGAWLLVMHYLDLYWVVVPALHPDGVRAHPLDLAALVGAAGTTFAFGTVLLRRAPLVPTGDPRLGRSLEFFTS